MNNRIAIAAAVLALVAAAWAQTTRPTTNPSGAKEDEFYNQLLTPAKQAPPPLLPVPPVATDATTANPVAPGGTQLDLRREGTPVIDRVGRLTLTADGKPEFAFESDGQAMKDPPMLILPNLKLMQMENAVKNASGPIRFRISGMVTEYNSRNYILIQKVLVAGQSR